MPNTITMPSNLEAYLLSPEEKKVLRATTEGEVAACNADPELKDHMRRALTLSTSRERTELVAGLDESQLSKVVGDALRASNIGDIPVAPDFAVPIRSFTIDENTASVGTISAAQVDGESVNFSVLGTDAALFSVAAATGVLIFKSAPDYEDPSDADTDNVYEIVMRATGAVGSVQATQIVNVTVGDVSALSA